jgi:prephenate dehydratase
VRAAYQGEPGAYSEAAALRLKSDMELLPRRSFEEVFSAVREGAATHGVLPIENSVAGSIHRNYDLLLAHELPIVGEIELPVEHCLLAARGTTLDGIRVVHSHPQALAQCEGFLQALGVEIVATYDTAGGAKIISEQGWKDAAAIASRRAAEIFDLEILRCGIQDFEANITRFFVVGRSPEPLGEPDKTTIVFSLPSEPGSLFKALSVFALRDVNLTKLESRPIPGRPWEYLFYADLAQSQHHPACARALVHLAEFARWVRTLGTYPGWKNPEIEATMERNGERQS